MRVTRRGWGAALAGLFLVALGLVLERPFLLVGGGLIGAWLLAGAAQFARRSSRTLADLTIEHHAERDRVVTRRPLAVTLSTSLAGPAPVALTLESQPPASTTVTDDDTTRIAVPVGAERAATTFLAQWPHAGRVSFDRPIVTATDHLERFRVSAATGPTPSISVVPRTPRDIHVGAGGEPTTAAFGDHSGARRGAGLDPAELRAYQPGDAATRIDWKATARLAEPYVREYEVETDRRTVLVVDHRGSMGLGPEGETALDHLREVALAYVDSARTFDDPLGYYTVGDEGLTGRWLPDANRQQYDRIARHLGGLEPTAATGSTAIASGPADARRLAERLGPGTAFGRTLGPYLDHAESYVSRIQGEPLYETIRTARETVRGTVWTVILTNDRAPAGLTQAITAARRGEGRVIVYLAPSALFEPGGLADLEAAYDRYVEFEELRRELSRSDRVDAYEVAPGDRIEAVLTAGRQRRRGAPAGGD